MNGTRRAKGERITLFCIQPEPFVPRELPTSVARWTNAALHCLHLVLIGCGTSRSSLPRRSAELSVWVGLWAPYDPEAVGVQLSLMEDGHFDYEFCPHLQSAPNSSTEITGTWKVSNRRLVLRERKVAHVPSRQMPHPLPAQIQTVDITVDVVPKQGGRVLVAPCPGMGNLRISLVRKSPVPRPINWRLIQ